MNRTGLCSWRRYRSRRTADNTPPSAVRRSRHHDAQFVLQGTLAETRTPRRARNSSVLVPAETEHRQHHDAEAPRDPPSSVRSSCPPQCCIPPMALFQAAARNRSGSCRKQRFLRPGFNPDSTTMRLSNCGPIVDPARLEPAAVTHHENDSAHSPESGPRPQRAPDRLGSR